MKTLLLGEDIPDTILDRLNREGHGTLSRVEWSDDENKVSLSRLCVVAGSTRRVLETRPHVSVLCPPIMARIQG